MKANKQTISDLRDQHAALRLRAGLTAQRQDKNFEYPTFASHLRKAAAFKHAVTHDIEDNVVPTIKRGADVLSEDKTALSTAEHKKHITLIKSTVAATQKAHRFAAPTM